MGFPKLFFPEWYYKFMVRSTNAGCWLGVGAGLVLSVLGFTGLMHNNQNALVLGFAGLGFAAIAFVARRLMIKWYGLMYRLAHGRYPDE